MSLRCQRVGRSRPFRQACGRSARRSLEGVRASRHVAVSFMGRFSAPSEPARPGSPSCLVRSFGRVRMPLGRAPVSQNARKPPSSVGTNWTFGEWQRHRKSRRRAANCWCEGRRRDRKPGELLVTASRQPPSDRAAMHASRRSAAPVPSLPPAARPSATE